MPCTSSQSSVLHRENYLVPGSLVHAEDPDVLKDPVVVVHPSDVYYFVAHHICGVISPTWWGYLVLLDLNVTPLFVLKIEEQALVADHLNPLKPPEDQEPVAPTVIDHNTGVPSSVHPEELLPLPRVR